MFACFYCQVYFYVVLNQAVLYPFSLSYLSLILFGVIYFIVCQVCFCFAVCFVFLVDFVLVCLVLRFVESNLGYFSLLVFVFLFCFAFQFLFLLFQFVSCFVFVLLFQKLFLRFVFTSHFVSETFLVTFVFVCSV